MTRTAADLDVFMSMINQNCAAKLAELEQHAQALPKLERDSASTGGRGQGDQPAFREPAKKSPAQWRG